MRIAISSGHGKYVRGASGYLDEVDEARRVVAYVAELLNKANTPTVSFNDDVSKTQSENLNRIVSWHNAQTRDLDISVHFNAYQTTSKAMGTECLYLTQAQLAADVSLNIAVAGKFINRGAKKRTDLAFLNGTNKPAILIEVCFVDSSADASLYRANFDLICAAIAKTVSGQEIAPAPEPLPPPTQEFYAKGKCSWFGGPEDLGVSPSEGLAFISSVDQAPHLFLPYQPSGTTGLARRLNPWVHFVACRWDYNVTSKETLRVGQALVKANGMELMAFPADWGPNQSTGRVADLSKGLLDDLKLTTDDQVEVIFPYKGTLV